MDNLQLYSSYILNINNKFTIKACSHVEDTIVCFVCENNILVHNATDGRTNNFYEIKELQEDLKYVQHLPVQNSIFLASKNELALFDITTEKTRIVQQFDKEILDLVWDSLQSVFVLINSEHELQIYSYADLSNRNFYTTLDSQVPGSVVVGWGSQNTQFQGHRKKRETDDSQKNQDCIFFGPPKISWRGNGEQFGISFFKNGSRFIKVFDNQLNPLFESEAYCNLTESISFMGQGQYIAGLLIGNDLNNLIIFEKNCKMKAITPLKETKGQIVKLLFHPQMNILGILSRDDKQNSLIDIYLYSNAKWYMKQQLFYPLAKQVNDFFWTEATVPLFTTCKMVLFTTKEVLFHTFIFVINRSLSKAITGVIDGRNLNINLFENTIIPPPMCSVIYEHKRPINRVWFHHDTTQCLLIDSQFQFTVISINSNSVDSLLSSSNLNLSSFLQIDWKKETEIDVHVGDENDISEYEENNVLLRIKNFALNNAFEYCVTDKPLNNQNVFLYQIEDDNMSVDVVLNACRELLINQKVLCSGVISALLFKTYLLWITSAGVLYCIRTKQLNKPLDLANTFSRPTEQGARIVCCNNKTPPQILMQLPRGNLETINCKMITIDIIDNMLSLNRWGEVLEIMRIEKINWNVLIDLNPKRFCDNIEAFVQAARFCGMLTNIVTDFDLKETCFKTLYKGYLEDDVVDTKISKKDIVEKILDFVCLKNCVNNLTCIVTIQQKHISLKSALISVKQVYSADTDKHEIVCTKAIKQILLQAHFKDILNTAFTLFDLRLLALIYRNSNEDPKVYTPDLMNLHNMTEVERRYRLCLKAYDLIGATKYLLACQHFEEEFITAFIVQKKMEHIAYQSVSNYNDVKSERFKLVSKLYAKRLMIEGKHVEAGLLLKRAGLYEESILQYQKALAWREIIPLMNLLNYSENQKVELLNKIAREMVLKNNLEDALILFEYHIKDYIKGVEYLVEHKAFHRAINMAKTYNLVDTLTNMVIPSLTNYTGILMDKLESLQSRFEEYAKRLHIIRENRQKQLQNEQDKDGFFHSGDDELYSETSSVSSSRSSRKTSSSRRSTLSSRNRRKEERKKTDLREGGYYEDIALMKVLHTTYDEVYEFTKETREICLIEELNDNEFCRNIQLKLNNLQVLMKDKRKEIWPEVFYKSPIPNDIISMAILQNKNDLDPQYSIPPSDELLSDSWKLAIFS